MAQASPAGVAGTPDRARGAKVGPVVRGFVLGLFFWVLPWVLVGFVGSVRGGCFLGGVRPSAPGHGFPMYSGLLFFELVPLGSDEEMV